MLWIVPAGKQGGRGDPPAPRWRLLRGSGRARKPVPPALHGWVTKRQLPIWRALRRRRPQKNRKSSG